MVEDAGRARPQVAHGRVTDRKTYARIQARGARVHTPHLVILVAPHVATVGAGEGTDAPAGITGDVHARPRMASRRLGITVTKRVAKRAVDRNRVKRLVREVFRRELSVFPDDCDVVVIAKPRAWDLGYAALAEEVRRARGAMAAAARRAASRPEGAA